MLLCRVESLVLFLILRTDLEKVVHSHPLGDDSQRQNSGVTIIVILSFGF